MTAVEWLEEQLNKIFISNEIQQTKHLFEQALKIEKQQIKDFYDAGYKDGNAIPGYDYFDDSESYYEKTYKKP